MNPFDFQSVAQRYAAGRPQFHAQVVEIVRELLRIETPVQRALDVGCGTGMSTRALRAIAYHVDGLDNSSAMLSEAEASDGVEFQHGQAEQMSFEGETFDLATVSSAFHWFDRHLFLRELTRVLRPDGYLVIYENAFPGRMADCPEFFDWQQSFYKRFPRTPRDTTPLTYDEAAKYGLTFLNRREYSNLVEFTARELSLYLSTQTNAIEAIERGTESVESLRTAIQHDVAQFFGDRRSATFEFCGFIWTLQKSST